MTHKKREQAAGLLLDARGFISCYFPIDLEPLNRECIMNGIRAGNLQNTMEKIDKVLSLLEHTGSGFCKKRPHAKRLTDGNI